MIRLYSFIEILQEELEKIREESTYSEDSHEIVPDSDQKEWEWSLLEVPVSEILDKYESHIDLHDEECCKQGSEHWSYEHPENHNDPRDRESHEELEYEHNCEFRYLWHFTRHGEV